MKKLILAATIFSISISASADAAGCKGSEALKGNYSFTAAYMGQYNETKPTTNVPQRTEIPLGCSSVGFFQFDGKGGATVSHVSGCHGYITEEGKFTKEYGTYTLDKATCSGKATFSAGTEDELTFVLVFDNTLSKASMLFNGVNQITGSGTLFKQ